MNAWQIKVRSLARKTGAIRLINRLRPASSYEQRAHEALTQAVKPGDRVWDVGANIGVYTELFCQWVGKDGSVVAFEPFADSCLHIRKRLPNCTWLQVENVALGDTDTTGRLVTGADSVENHIATASETTAASSTSIPVVICRGDTVSARVEHVPNVMKIDVEGFEEEVLMGMGSVLASPELRSVLVEVHFKKLEDRGSPTAPIRIEKLLAGNGFQTRWVDASHLFATRSS